MHLASYSLGYLGIEEIQSAPVQNSLLVLDAWATQHIMELVEFQECHLHRLGRWLQVCLCRAYPSLHLSLRGGLPAEQSEPLFQVQEVRIYLSFFWITRPRTIERIMQSC